LRCSLWWGDHKPSEAFADQITAPKIANLNAALEARKSPLRAEVLAESFATIAGRAGMRVVAAASPDPDRISDIRLELDDGHVARVEVKAQTTQSRNQLGSADWTHDITDTLRWLYANDAEFRRRVPPWLQSRLEVPDPIGYFEGWGFGSLWACDIARLRDPARRERAGVTTPAELHDFLSRFYLLHVTRIGARLIPLGDVAAIRAAIEGHVVDYAVTDGRKSSAVVSVRPAAQGPRRSPGFVYYVGYGQNAVGRHKLHGWVLEGAPGIIEVQHA
jgi:hypothetical protein